MDKEEIWNLIAKKLAGEASPEELLELGKALRQDPGLHYSLEALQDMWVSNPVHEHEQAEKAFEKHLERMRALAMDPAPLLKKQAKGELPAVNRPISKNKVFAYSVFGLVMITLGIFVFRTLSGNAALTAAPKTTCEVITRNGSKTNLLLPDGTSVWLNAGSRLTYDSLFGTHIREVTLSGEGFFDVVKNPSKPFIIHTGEITIRVLGTAFDVKSYPQENTIETSLIRGSIEVSFTDHSSKKIILRPYQKLVIEKKGPQKNTGSGRTESSPAVPFIMINRLNHSGSDSTLAETAWIQNRLTFADMSLKDLVKEMERKYGIPILLQDSGLDTLHFTGSFQNETILEALDALRLTAEKSTTDFTYRMDGNKVLIYNISNGHSIQPK